MNELPINQVVTGDCREVMAEWPEDCIDFVMFSPPFWGLRDYGEEAESVWDGDSDCEHNFEVRERKTTQGGNPGATAQVGATKTGVQREIIEEGFCSKCGAWKGQLGLEPSYRIYVQHLVDIGREIKRILKPSGSWYLNLGDTYAGSGCGTNDYRGRTEKYASTELYNKPSPQSKTKIPAKCKLLMPYRIALALIDDGWICRNDITWLKPNPMPSSVKDRLNTTTERIFHFVKEKEYYYDLDVIREPHKEESKARAKRSRTSENKWFNGAPSQSPQSLAQPKKELGTIHPKGKNPGDVIELPTQPFPEAHFAVYPPELCEKPIKSSCPRDGIVLDPMCGAGSTLVMAKQLGRKYIGIEISDEYADIARERLRKGDENYRRWKRKERELKREAEGTANLEEFCETLNG